MKQTLSALRTVAVAWAVGGLTAGSAIAAVSLHAPYDTDFDLDVGLFPQPLSTNGSPGLTTGFPISGGPPGGALDVPARTNGLHYAQVANYFVGVTNGPIGANTFRLLYKPDFSGEQPNLRRYIFGGGGYGTGNSFQLYNSDDTDGPRALFTRGGAINLSLAFNDFVWDANTWYYMGVSFDSTGGTFYMRAMTNGAIANVQTAAFANPTWSDSGLASGSVNVGISQPNTEGAEGQIDDLKVFSNERWSESDFAFDFALVVPEPSTMLLIAGGLGTLVLRKRRVRG